MAWPLFLALLSGGFAFSPPEGGSSPANLTQHGREMSSPGCQNCCIQHDCRLAYMMTSPGVCCGMHPATGAMSCCPFDSSCVRCRSKWRCTRSKYITRSTKCQVCGDDKPSDCFYRQPVYHHSGGSNYSFMLMILLLAFCAMGACAYQRQGGGFYDEPVMVQQGAPQITGYTPNGQPIYAQPQVVMAQGGYGGGSVAGAAATGFVGGMLVGEALDAGHGGYGGGYGGGGYGGEYGGGGGGFGGGDGGFEAD